LTKIVGENEIAGGVPITSKLVHENLVFCSTISGKIISCKNDQKEAICSFYQFNLGV